MTVMVTDTNTYQDFQVSFQHYVTTQNKGSEKAVPNALLGRLTPRYKQK